MNTLREALQDYLALRRGLGFKLYDAGLLLPRFVAFMEEHQAPHITTRLALEWVQQAKAVRPAERARRLGFVRGFARYRSATDPLTEVPSSRLLPQRLARARPYLYTEQEVRSLLRAALQRPTAWPSTRLRPWVTPHSDRHSASWIGKPGRTRSRTFSAMMLARSTARSAAMEYGRASNGNHDGEAGGTLAWGTIVRVVAGRVRPSRLPDF